MKKILSTIASIALATSTTYASSIESKIDEAKSNLQQALKDDRVYQMFATVGMTTMDRSNDYSGAELTVNNLYEVEAGVKLLPDTYNITIAYKSAIDREKSIEGSRDSIGSSGKTMLITADVLSHKKYGYLNVAYSDVTLSGELKNTGTNSIYLNDIVDDGKYANNPTGMLELRTGDKVGTIEKARIAGLIYRLPMMPNIGVIASHIDRTLPVVIDLGMAMGASMTTDVEGMSYGVGYFEDLAKAPQNSLVIQSVMLLRGTLDTTTVDILGDSVNGKNQIDSLFCSLGYKYGNLNLSLNSRYSKSQLKDFDNAQVQGFDQTELRTTFTVGMTF